MLVSVFVAMMRAQRKAHLARAKESLLKWAADIDENGPGMTTFKVREFIEACEAVDEAECELGMIQWLR